ncbi:hypothetical protein [Candidatus Methylacidithermus pantelleriae]|uniref:hypothetical protein n=1 Tax=Candidatus Methylacidithermus pantelleriae TaxID=2744239 RepID=UPI001BD4314D|nr:hypothetical protein [Candidatus Methylacidithermus pantelleriae]
MAVIGQKRPKLIEEAIGADRERGKNDPQARGEEPGIERFAQEKAAAGHRPDRA